MHKDYVSMHFSNSHTMPWHMPCVHVTHVHVTCVHVGGRGVCRDVKTEGLQNHEPQSARLQQKQAIERQTSIPVISFTRSTRFSLSVAMTAAALHTGRYPDFTQNKLRCGSVAFTHAGLQLSKHGVIVNCDMWLTRACNSRLPLLFSMIYMQQ